VEWEKNNDLEYVLEKINYAWHNRDELSKNAREWYMKNCSFDIWSRKMRSTIECQ